MWKIRQKYKVRNLCNYYIIIFKYLTALFCQIPLNHWQMIPPLKIWIKRKINFTNVSVFFFLLLFSFLRLPSSPIVVIAIAELNTHKKINKFFEKETNMRWRIETWMNKFFTFSSFWDILIIHRSSLIRDNSFISVSSFGCETRNLFHSRLLNHFEMRLGNHLERTARLQFFFLYFFFLFRNELIVFDGKYLHMRIYFGAADHVEGNAWKKNFNLNLQECG